MRVYLCTMFANLTDLPSIGANAAVTPGGTRVSMAEGAPVFFL